MYIIGTHLMFGISLIHVGIYKITMQSGMDYQFFLSIYLFGFSLTIFLKCFADVTHLWCAIFCIYPPVKQLEHICRLQFVLPNSVRAIDT